MMNDRKRKSKPVKPRKAKKAAKTAKSKVLAKKRAAKMAQDEPKPSSAVPEQGQNVPEKAENVPAELTYDQLLARLPAKRARFVEEYLIDLEPTKAAIRAGYSEHTADRQSSRLLKYAEVKETVAAGRREISERNKDRFEEAMEELRILAFSDIKNHVDVDEMTGAIRCKGFEEMPDRSSRAIESISEDRVIRETQDGTQIIINDKRKFKLHNKVTALVAYIDRVSPPVQKVQLTGPNGGPIRYTDVTDEELLNIARGGGARAAKTP